MDTADARWFFRSGAAQKLHRDAAAQKDRAHQRSLFQSTQFHEIASVSPVHSGSGVHSGRVPPVLGKTKTRLRDCRHARGNPERSVIRGNEIAPAALPAVFDGASAPEVPRT